MPEAGYSSAVPVADRVFITGNLTGNSTIFCLDAATGKPIWTYSNGKAWTETFAGTRQRNEWAVETSFLLSHDCAVGLTTVPFP